MIWPAGPNSDTIDAGASRLHHLNGDAVALTGPVDVSPRTPAAPPSTARRLQRGRAGHGDGGCGRGLAGARGARSGRGRAYEGEHRRLELTGANDLHRDDDGRRAGSSRSTARRPEVRWLSNQGRPWVAWGPRHDRVGRRGPSSRASSTPADSHRERRPEPRDRVENFVVALNGATAGTGYGQVSVSGQVDPRGRHAGTPRPGLARRATRPFTIVNNTGSNAVIGTFEGASGGTPDSASAARCYG